VARNLNEALANLVGGELSSVEFVRDYVQLRFDGPTLTAYTMPTVRSSAEFIDGQIGYESVLRKLIGITVQSAKCGESALEIRFADGATISISTAREHYQGPEAFQFVDDRSTFVV
jgi:hypothetical protein